MADGPQALPLAVSTAVERRRGDLTGWIVDLVRTPSVTGDEAAAQAVVASLMTEIGLTVDRFVPDDATLRRHPSFSDDGLPVERPVVVGRRNGADPAAPSLILNGHIDVVPTGDEGAFPEGVWSGRVREGLLWGRGACDMKAGLVVALAALAVLADLGIQPAGDVIVESVTGEETGGVGTLATILAGYTADAAVILEPTGLAVCPVGAGAASFRLHVPGRAAHGALRTEGHSAVDSYLVLHQALAGLERDRHAGWTHPAYEPGTLVAPISVGRIQSGNWPSTVPEQLVAEGRFGVLPGEGLDTARHALERAVHAAASTDPWLTAHPPRVEWFEGQFAPAVTPVDAPLLKALGRVHEQATGRRPQVHGVTYGSDLRFFTNDASMPAVLYGPGDVRLAHTADERIDLDEVLRATVVIALLVAGGGWL